MNYKYLTITIFVLIILGGLGVFFMNAKNTKDLAAVVSPTAAEASPSASQVISITSKDGRVSFLYPRIWQLNETTGAVAKGKFGPIYQSWVLTSFDPETAGEGAIPANTAKVDIQIQTGGQNLPLQSLVSCTGSGVTCETIGIDNEQFIKRTLTLSSGETDITIGSFYDDKILLLSAQVAAGEKRTPLMQTVDSIFNSITFSE